MIELPGHEFERQGEWWLAYRVLDDMWDDEEFPADRISIARSPCLLHIIKDVRQSCIVNLAKGQMKIMTVQYERALEAVMAEAACVEEDIDNALCGLKEDW